MIYTFKSGVLVDLDEIQSMKPHHSQFNRYGTSIILRGGGTITVEDYPSEVEKIWKKHKGKINKPTCREKSETNRPCILIQGHPWNHEDALGDYWSR